MEVVTSSDGGDSQELPPGLWQSVSDDQPHAETVTVTLTQSPGEGTRHIDTTLFVATQTWPHA